MPKEDLAVKVMERHADLEMARRQWDDQFDGVKRFLRPHVPSFYNSTTNGQPQTDDIFDSTPVWCNDQLAAGMHSFLTSPVDRWFDIGISGMPQLMMDDSELLWLEGISTLMYEHFSNPDSMFNQSMHELYLDLGAFGTAVMSQERRPSGLLFRTYPLADCYIHENSDGIVDTLHRRLPMTVRQIRQMFGQTTKSKKINETPQIDKEFDIIHACFPADDDDQYARLTKLPWVSVFIVKETKEILQRGGFNTFPFHVVRWLKMSGEVYGRSPGIAAMPEIRMLNAFNKAVIKGVQKMVDPPLLVPDDGYMMPIKTAPGSLIFHETGMQDKVEPLITGGRPDLGEMMIDKKREQIAKAFYVDWLLQQKKNNVEMTATEVMDRREEQLRMLAPILGRIQSELCGPLIRRAFNLLKQNGVIPEAPQSLQGSKLSIAYVSPAARAQSGSRGQATQAYLQDLAPLGQLAPDSLDIIDTDQLAAQMAKWRDVPRTVLRTRDQVNEIRTIRAKKQQMQEAMNAGQQMAATMKDVASAQQAPV